MQRYHFFHRNQNFRNGKPCVKSFDCAYERWGDVRTKIEEMLGISRALTAQGKKKYDSLFGCVVGNEQTHKTWALLHEECLNSRVDREFSILADMAKLLPPLEKGSLLINGDLIIIAVVPYKQVLYFEDIWHRYWLFCLMKKHFSTRGQEVQFEKDIRRYDLKQLTCRVVALSKQNDIKTIKKDYNQLIKHYVIDGKEDSLFEFGSACKPLFGKQIYVTMCEALHNICIEFDWHTRFFSKLIRESGGALEYGSNLAKRLGIEQLELIQLVRDVLHNYEPLYSIKEINLELEESVDEKKNDDTMIHVDEAPQKKRKMQLEEKKLDREDETDACKVDNNELEIKDDLQDEDDKIRQVIDGANDTGPKHINQSAQIYCLCCDVPGHHTLLCPRLDFLENLRIAVSDGIFAIPEYIFYAPQNGICPIPNSMLSQYLNRQKPTLAGVINRKNQKNVSKDCSLPPLPYYNDVRWSIDL